MTAFPRRPTAVVLGAMSKTPVAGSIWQTVAYVVGLERLGFETYYVEAHARTPTTLMERGDDDSSALAAGFVDGVMRRFGLADRWALHALHADGRVYGLSVARLARLYEDAACILNLHGGTLPRPEHVATRRLVYVETDPVELQVQLDHGDAAARELLEAHCAFFTLGTNFGAPDCGVPLPPGFAFKPTLPPVLLDQWELEPFGSRPLFTTVGNWRQEFRDVSFRGEVYRWSKHHEFLKLIDLPSRTEQRFELALASDDESSSQLLLDHGWGVRDAFKLSLDLDAYRRYIVESRGEFTVAKDQNIRLRSGWFSDRSATYLAAGCPVITQDTGFAAALPVGDGLFAFSTVDEILAAVEQVNRDHGAAARAAREIAREHLDAERVLGAMLDELGLGRPGVAAVESRQVPPDLDLRPVSRWPTVLAEDTVTSTARRPLPPARPRDLASARPDASVVVVTCDNLVFTRLCLESVLGAGDLTPFELIVIDNGSTDGTHDYLDALTRRDPRVRAELGSENLGFPAAVNRGLRAARGEQLILLNNDTIVTPGWLTGLASHLDDGRVGLIGAVSNRAATEAQVETSYATYGGFLELAGERLRTHAGRRTPISSLTLFCAGLRRDVYERVGALDERFGLGMFEDDDYVHRVREAGYEIACAEDVLVHHFGQASIGWLARSGSYGALFAENRKRYDEKWATSWRPHRQRRSPARTAMIERAGAMVERLVPEGATVLVVSKGDDAVLQLAGRHAEHFPQDGHGAYAGYHPADASVAIAELDRLTAGGASHLLIPRPSLWWLDHYAALREHLDQRGSLLSRDEDAGALYALEQCNQRPRDRRAA
ncbi:MAG TPA: glycosyltransferase family 2 protein [Conexibacter sp.]|nr:glycosyltransferase family 2 protein [Conexibacter sp.]